MTKGELEKLYVQIDDRGRMVLKKHVLKWLDAKPGDTVRVLIMPAPGQVVIQGPSVIDPTEVK